MTDLFLGKSKLTFASFFPKELANKGPWQQKYRESHLSSVQVWKGCQIGKMDVCVCCAHMYMAPCLWNTGWVLEREHLSFRNSNLSFWKMGRKNCWNCVAALFSLTPLGKSACCVQFNWKLTWNILVWVSSLQMSAHTYNESRTTWEFERVYIHSSGTEFHFYKCCSHHLECTSSLFAPGMLHSCWSWGSKMSSMGTLFTEKY